METIIGTIIGTMMLFVGAFVIGWNSKSFSVMMVGMILYSFGIGFLINL